VYSTAHMFWYSFKICLYKNLNVVGCFYNKIYSLHIGFSKITPVITILTEFIDLYSNIKFLTFKVRDSI